MTPKSTGAALRKKRGEDMWPKIALLVGPILLLTAGVVWGGPGDGLADSSHDFSQTEGGVGVCAFCHTPHRALGTRLLWNHTLSSATYSWQDIDRTIGGTELPTITRSWTGPSKYCLSCHDGSVAIGDVNWWRSQKPGAPLDFERHQWPDEYNIGATGGILGNMSGNHPVAFPYPFQNARNTYNGVTTGENVIVSEFVADPTVVHIRLFTNPSGDLVQAGTLPGRTGIECSSCHDPHNGPTVEGDYFIRGQLTGSTLAEGYICLKCHAK